MKNKRFQWLGPSLIIGMLLTACSGAVSTDTVPQPSNDNNESAGVPIADYVLDPANATSINVKAAAGYVYEGLVRTENGAVIGVLAEAFIVSEDGLDYIFDLRPGINFHDGSVLNADVVVANFNRWSDPKDVNRGSGEFSAWVENFGGFKGETTEDGKPKSEYDGIEKVNNFTVLVHLNTPDPDFLTKIADSAFTIASLNSLKNGGDGGSGPYKVIGKSDVGLTLAPFTEYWSPAAIPDKDLQIPFE